MKLLLFTRWDLAIDTYWIRRVKNFHIVLMMQYLRKRGWVVFYLPEDARRCCDGICWIKSYNRVVNNG